MKKCTSNKIATIILAAGNSERFGSNKLAHRISERCILEITIEQYQLVCDDVFVVVSQKNKSLIETKINERNIIEISESGNQPMISSSINAGVKHISLNNRFQSCLISLADKPFIQKKSILAIRDGLQHHKIVIPTHNNKHGHPVGFHSTFFDKLKSFKSQKGARSVITNNLASTYHLELDDSGIVFDIDEPEDLKKAELLFPSYFRNVTTKQALPL